MQPIGMQPEGMQPGGEAVEAPRKVRLARTFMIEVPLPEPAMQPIGMQPEGMQPGGMDP
jgi:hypothetical protein